MRARYRILICLLALVVWGCAEDREAEKAAQARRIYAEFCGNCHGRDLRGGMASNLADGVWKFGASDAEVLGNIADGIEQAGMPGFRRGLEEAELRALVWLIRAVERDSTQVGKN